MGYLVFVGSFKLLVKVIDKIGDCKEILIFKIDFVVKWEEYWIILIEWVYVLMYGCIMCKEINKW